MPDQRNRNQSRSRPLPRAKRRSHQVAPVHCYQALFSAVEHATEPIPADLVKAIQTLPDSKRFPGIRQSRTLIDLVIEDHLGAWANQAIVPSLLELPLVQESLDRRLSLEGRVPDHTDWYFHLQGGRESELHLHRRSTNEATIVQLTDRDDDESEQDDDEENESSSPRSEPLKGLARKDDEPEQDDDEENESSSPRSKPLKGLARKLDDTPIDWGDKYDDSSRVELVTWLASELQEHEDSIRSFHERLQDPAQRVWLAAVIGDWPTAHAAALVLGKRPLVTITGDRAKRSVRERPNEAQDQLGMNGNWLRDGTVRTLGERSIAYFTQLLRRAFKSVILDARVDGLDVVVRADLDGWEDDVYRVLREVLLPEQLDWQALGASYLLRRKYRTRAVLGHLIGQLRKGHSQWHLPSALLTLLFHVDTGKQIVKKALGSPAEMERIEALALLHYSRPSGVMSLLRLAHDNKDFPVAAACHRIALQQRDRISSEQTNKSARKSPGKVIEVRGTEDSRNPWAIRYLGTMNEFFSDQIQKVKNWKSEMKLDNV